MDSSSDFSLLLSPKNNKDKSLKLLMLKAPKLSKLDKKWLIS
jgi:hypothetical protein